MIERSKRCMTIALRCFGCFLRTVVFIDTEMFYCSVPGFTTPSPNCCPRYIITLLYCIIINYVFAEYTYLFVWFSGLNAVLRIPNQIIRKLILQYFYRFRRTGTVPKNLANQKKIVFFIYITFYEPEN